MSRNLRILLLAILSIIIGAVVAEAQNVAIGERAPSLRKAKVWLGNKRPPRDRFARTLLCFIHSESLPCMASARRIAAVAPQCEEGLRVVMMTKESTEEIERWLAEYADGERYVACACAETFKMYEVNYAPFAVLLDCRRRPLWFGNPKMLDNETLIRITRKPKDRKWHLLK